MNKKQASHNNSYFSLLKIILKVLSGIFRVTVIMVVAYFLSAVILTVIPVNSDYTEPEEGVDVFLVSNGAHVDIATPVQSEEIDWREWVPFEMFAGAEESRYISFGWGDKRFYLNTPTWADLELGTAFRSLFIPTGSAMHVSLYMSRPRGEHVHRVRISPESYMKMIDHIRKSFEYDENGKVKVIDCCDYAGIHDRFFEARGKYHMFQTSNNWTNDCMKKAGVKSSVWAPMEFSVLYHHYE